MNANHKGWLYYLIVNYLYVWPSNSTVEIFSNPVSDIDFFEASSISVGKH